MPPSTRASTLRPVVLIVEDDADTRELYETALAFGGMQASSVSRASDAYAFADEQRPDAIVSDLSLGATGGVELAQKLKANDRTAHIPILAVTGWDPRTLSAVDGLFEDVLVKPIDPELLLARLQEMIQKAAAVQPPGGRGREEVVDR